MATTMTQDDLSWVIDEHRASPQRCPAYMVAGAMLRFRKQIGLDVRPRDLCDAIGISYDRARHVLKEAKGSTKPADLQPAGGRPADLRPADLQPQNRLTSSRPPTPPLEEEVIRTSVVDGGGGETVGEPFHGDAFIPAFPLPPGRTSKEAAALRAKYDAYGHDDDGTTYGEIAAALCDGTRADWIDLYFEHQLALWNRRPGFVAAAKAMKRWRDDGKPGWRYTQTAAADNPPPALKATGTSGPAPRSNTPQTAEERERFVREMNEL